MGKILRYYVAQITKFGIYEKERQAAKVAPESGVEPMSFEAELTQIINQYDLILLVSFGSYQTGRFTAKSDIDLAYQARVTLHSEQQLDLLSALVALFKRDRIDLVDLARANPLLLYEVACSGQVFYEEEDAYLRFQLKAWARYAETKFLRQKRRAYLDSLANELKG